MRHGVCCVYNLFMEGQSLATVKVNTYLALLIIAVIGSGAAWFVIRAAYSTYLPSTIAGSSAEYSALEQLILSE